MAAKNFKMAAKGLKIEIFFTTSTLKFEFKIINFTALFYLHMFVIMYNQFDIITQEQQAKQFKMDAKSSKWLPESLKLGKIHQYTS